MSTTPDPIAFEKFMNGLVVDIAFGIFDREDLPRFVDKAVKAHNQSLQTAVTQARINELKRWKKAAFQDDYNFSMYDIDRIKELTKEDSKS